METQLLTPNQVAHRLQINLSTVYAWLKAGRLSGVRLGNRWRVSEDALKGLVASKARASDVAKRKAPPPGASAESTYDLLAALFDEATRDIPAEEWDRLPHDLAVNHDHYLYGVPKVKNVA